MPTKVISLELITEQSVDVPDDYSSIIVKHEGDHIDLAIQHEGENSTPRTVHIVPHPVPPFTTEFPAIDGSQMLGDCEHSDGVENSRYRILMV